MTVEPSRTRQNVGDVPDSHSKYTYTIVIDVLAVYLT